MLKTAGIVIVEPDTQGARALQATLEAASISSKRVATPQAALALLAHRPADLLLAKLQPEQMFADLPALARKIRPGIKVILLLAQPDCSQIELAISQKAFDVLTTPVTNELVLQAVREALDSSSRRLPARAAKALADLGQVRQAAIESVTALVKAVEAKDPYTRRHSEHVAYYAVRLAAELGLDADHIESVRTAALLHDVGKIGVPDHILVKAGRLSQAEFEQVRRHPVLGSEILAKITLFRDEATLVRHHHERWDGKGYPDGLVGDQTPLSARVILIADCLDAMLMERTYKNAYSVDKVLGELSRCEGTQFDPALADLALRWCRWNPSRLILPGRDAKVLLSA